MSYWIKLYTEILRDPKMGRLTDRQYRTCISLFLVAGDCGLDGDLPSINDLSWLLHTDPEDLIGDMNALQGVGILTLDGMTDIWSVTHWQKRQAKPPSDDPERVAERVSAHRKRAKECRVSPPDNDHNELVTPLRDSNNDTVAPHRGEEETEKKERENRSPTRAKVATQNVFEAFNQARGGAINPMDAEQLGELEDLYGADATIRAIGVCNQNRDRPFLGIGYISKTLAGWQRDGKIDIGGNGQPAPPQKFVGPATLDFNELTSPEWLSHGKSTK